MPLPFETARERDARIFRQREEAKDAARADLGAAEERERLLTAVAALGGQPGVVVPQPAPLSLHHDPGAIPGQAEVCEQHWGQA